MYQASPAPPVFLRAEAPRVKPRPVKVSVLPVAYLMVASYIFSLGRLQELVHVLSAIHPAKLCMGLSLLYIALNLRTLRDIPALRTWPPYVIVGLMVLSVVGAPFGLAAGAVFSFVMDDWLPTLLFFFLQIYALRGIRELKVLNIGFLVAIAILCINSIFFTKVVEQYGSYVARLDDQSGSMWDPNDMCVALMMALPLIVVTFQTSRLLGKLISLGMGLGIMWVIALSGSRGGFLGLVMVCLTMLYLANHIPASRRVGLVVGGLVVLAIAAPSGYWKQMGTIFSPKGDYNWSSNDGRKAIWTRGAKYMVSYPVFGLGLGNFSKAECSISDMARHPDPTAEANICAAPHNSFVQVGAELGLPGLAVWVSLLWGAFFIPLRIRRRLPRAWKYGDADQRYIYYLTQNLPLMSMGFACTAFFVSHAWTDMYYSLAVFTAGFFVVLRRKVRELKEAESLEPPNASAAPIAPQYAPAAVRRRPVLRPQWS